MSAAAVITASFLVGVTPTTASAATNAPQVQTLLANTLVDQQDDEIRIDLVLQVPADSVNLNANPGGTSDWNTTHLRVEFAFQGGPTPNMDMVYINTLSGGAQGAQLEAQNTGQAWTVHKVIKSGAYDYLVMSLEGDMGAPSMYDYSDPGGVQGPLGLRFTLWNNGQASSTPTSYNVPTTYFSSTPRAENVSGPVIPTPFDGSYALNPSSQVNWGTTLDYGINFGGIGGNPGAGILGPNTYGVEIKNPAFNPANGTLSGPNCSVSDSFWYEWVYQDNSPITAINTAPVHVTGITPNQLGSAAYRVVNATQTGYGMQPSGFVNHGQPGLTPNGAMKADGSIDFNQVKAADDPSDTGYYKLLVWPEAHDPATVTSTQANRPCPSYPDAAAAAGAVDQAQVLATQFYKFDLQRPAAPTITSPASQSTVADTTPTISGTGVPGDSITIKNGNTILLNGYGADASVIVGADGKWSWDLTPALAAGTYVLTAEQTERDSGFYMTSDPASTTFRIASPDPSKSTLTLDKTTAIANGTDAVTATVLVQDANGGIAGLADSVSLKVPAGVSVTGPVDAGGGSYTFKLTSNDVITNGTVQAFLDMSGTPTKVGIDKTVSFTVSDPDVTKSSWVVDKVSAAADGTEEITATVTVKDTQEHAVPGATVALQVPSDVTSVSPTVDNGDGTYTIKMKSSKVVVNGAVKAVVTVRGSPAEILPAKTVSFTAGAADAAHSSFDVSPTAVTTDVAAGVPVTVTTADASGHPVPGQVTLTAPNGALIKLADGTTAPSATVQTDANGRGTAAVVSDKPGSFTITASIGANAVSKLLNDTATFTVGAPSAAKSTFVITPDNATTKLPASGKDAYTGTVTVNDAHGVAVPSAPVKLTVPAGLTAKVNGSAVTDGQTVTAGADGKVVITYTTTAGGSYSVGAFVNSADRVGDAEILQFESTEPDTNNPNTKWVLLDSPATADGQDTATVQITLRDSGDLPVKDLPAASFRIDTDSAVQVSTVTQSSTPGTYTATLKSTKSGTYPVSVQVMSNGTFKTVSTSPQNVVFEAGPASAAQSTIQVTTGAVEVGGTHDVTVTVKDANGNAAKAGETVQLTAATGLHFTGSCSGTTCQVTTDANGIAKATVSSDTAGTYAVTATIGGTSVPIVKDGSNNPLNTATYKEGVAVAANSDWVVTGSAPKKADGKDAYTGKFTAKDAKGNLVPGTSVTIRVPSDVQTRDAGDHLLANSGGTVTVTTGSDGTVTVSFVTLKANASPGYPVSAALGGSQVDSETNLVFVGTDPDVTNSGTKWELAGSPATADGKDSVTATIHLVDANGNPVAGAVKVTPSSSDVKASAPVAVSGQPGVYTVELTSTKKGQYTGSAFVTVGGDDKQINPASLSYEFVSGPVSVQTSGYSVSSGQVAADDTATHTVTATIKDASGNPVSGERVTFNVVSPAHFSNGAQAIDVQTDANGVATAPIASATAGRYAVTARVAAGNLTGAAGATDALFAVGAADATKSTWQVTGAGPKKADGIEAYTGTFQANDATSNPVPYTTVTIKVPAEVTVTDSSSRTLTRDAGAGTVTVVTDDKGKATVTFTSKAAGSYAGVGAYLGSTQVGADSTLEFVAGNVDASKSTFSVATTDGSATVVADGRASWTATIVAKDGSGNPVSGVASQLSVSSSAGNVVKIGQVVEDPAHPGTYTALITSTTPNTTADPSYPVTAKTGTSQIGQEQDVVFVTGAPVGSMSDLTAAPTSVRAGGTAKSTVTVRLRDAQGHALTTSGGDVEIYVVDGEGSVSSTTDNGDGTYTATVGSLVEGTGVVSFRLNGAAVPSKSVTISFTDATAPSAPVVNPTNGKTVTGTGETAGDTITVKSGDSVLCTAKVQSDGSWSCTPAPAPADGTKLSVTETDPTGNESPATQVTVDAKVPGKPVVDPTDGSKVTGKAEPGSTVTVTDPATGAELCTVKADLTGKFTCTPDEPIADGTTVEVTAKDAAGNESAPTEVTVDSAAPKAPVVDPSNGGEVTGSAEPNSTVKVTDPETGDVLCTAKADATTGRFTCDLVPDVTEDGTNLEVTATDPTGNESPATEVTVDTAAPAAPAVNPTNGKTVTGTGETAGDTITVMSGDSVLCTAKVKSDGTWGCNPSPTPTDGTTLSVTESDASGNTSPATQVTVDAKAPGKPVVDPTDGSKVTGKAEPGSTVTVTDPATGAELCTAKANATTGKFTCTPDEPIADGATVEVTAKDAAGNESAPTEVTVDSAAPKAPVVDPSNGGEVTGSAEPNSTVKVTDPETGDVLCTAKADAQGKFTCEPDPAIEDGATVEVTATDPAGNKSPATDVTIDASAPAAPEVNPTNGKTVTGTGETPGDTITVKSDDTTLCTAKVKADGTWSCTPLPTPGDGAELTVTETDPTGNVSDSTTVTVDATAPKAPKVDPTNGDKVTGVAEPDSTVKVTDPETDVVLCTAKADSRGNFTCTPEDPIADGTTVDVTATDPAGNVSNPTEVTVDGSAPGSPVVDPSNGSNVGGTGETPGDKITVTDDEGTTLCTATVQADKTWSCTPQPTPEDGDEITVTETDKTGNESGETTKVIDATAPDAPVVNPSKGDKVTGSAEAGSTVTVTDPETGDVLCTATATSAGKFSCAINPAVPNGTQLEATATDPAGNVSDPTEFTTDSKAPGKPQVNPSDGASFTGKAEPGSTVTVTDPETGDVLCTAKANATTGRFTCTPDEPIADGVTVEVTATDPAGNESRPTEVTVDSTAPAAPVVDPSNGEKVTGKAEPGSTVTVTDPSTGDLLCKATADAQGTFTCTPNPAIEDGATVEVTATDPAGNESPATDVTVDASAPAAPTVAPTQGDKVTGTAEPGSTVTVTDRGTGEVLCTAKVNTAGKFTCDVDPDAPNDTVLDVTATDKAGNTSPATTVTTDSLAPDAPVVNPGNGSVVRGTAEPGSKVVLKDATGKVLGTVTADEDGEWSITPNRALTPGEEVSATATDAAGNVSDKATALVLGEAGHPGLHVTVDAVAKDANGATAASIDSVYDTVKVTFTVTNTGDETVSGLTIAPSFPLGHADGLSDIACPSWELAPGAAVTCSAIYDVTQVDLDNGTVTVAAVVTGDAHAADGVTVTKVTSNRSDDSVTVSGVSVGAKLVKSAKVTRTVNGQPTVVARANRVGDTVTYVFTLYNTGGVTLTRPQVSDPLAGLSAVDCPATQAIAPGENLACTATYQVTQADLAAGQIVNTATATLQAPAAVGRSVNTAASSVVIPTRAATDDSDGDGIPDVDEGDGDTDGDGIPDYQDPDSDGDGIPDVDEGDGDTDGDGIPDYQDPDSDGDGIPDVDEGDGDTDGDGIPDYQDPDSDGDGIPDVDEGDGDTDGDGVPDYQDTDSDGDGIPDRIEGDGDTDGDGVPDYLDTDSDGDGIPDRTEGSGDADNDGIPNFQDTDSDNDGIPDRVEGTGDTDGDGVPDYLDTDSDGDGIPDRQEGNGDTDGDGIPDYKDTDSDGDGIPDRQEGTGDKDGDGIPDYKDNDAQDTDGDGIPDVIEGDGDTDGDGIPDYRDTDSDGDGIPDADEGTGDPDGDGIPNFQDTDSDGDGIPDADEGTGDPDGDGIPNYQDTDSDGDGIPDADEGTGDPDGDGKPNYQDTDSDGDGIPDADEGTGDPDGDGKPNYQDTDSDGDGIPDANEGTGDPDGDGKPNYQDPDSDGDGIPDANEGQGDTDGDGVPDYQDTDSDGDGVPDANEGQGDTDGDGIPDYRDADSWPGSRTTGRGPSFGTGGAGGSAPAPSQAPAGTTLPGVLGEATVIRKRRWAVR
ncbi:Ig-like domain-containing protein [Xylanimonas allomyrinae]|uniref:Ig-like domain-containing protein n=1 Tax=Xylanimonas allomyrinae TaxID=2509459 RepID=UPI0013A61931|nr:Ig-like domain-containing protein [Xylanimonas allomyrinae]